MSDETINNYPAFIWSVADLLRGVYKQSEYGRVILPLTVLRRLDCVLEPTKDKVLERAAKLPEYLENRGPVLAHAAGQSFYNTSKHTFTTLLADPDNVAGSLRNYIAGFSESARDIIVKFNFDVQIDRLAEHNLLYLVVSKFADLDMSPETVTNLEMGYIYEELIRRFSELSNETAGEHFTPREVIRLMVNLLFVDDDELLTKPGIVKTMLDPACGTGGMLSVSEEYLRNLNPQGRLHVYGQEVNAETYATCRADMLIKGQDASRIRFGNSFDNDQHPNRRFDYLLANPSLRGRMEDGRQPRQVRTQDQRLRRTVRRRHTTHQRRQLPVPPAHDLQDETPRPDGGARLAIVFNGSPLFTGAARSGESEIRRWIIENDWLEAVVALPDQLFYNTGISTYFWVVTNRKNPKRRGKIQLIDARESWTKMRKSLGNKRKQISQEQIAELTRLYGAYRRKAQGCKIFPNESFGFLRITVERPLQLRWEITDDTLASVATDKKSRQAPTHHARPTPRQAPSQPRRHLPDRENCQSGRAGRARLGHRRQAGADGQRGYVAALTVRDPDAPAVTAKGKPKPDPTLRDYENVPLTSQTGHLRVRHQQASRHPRIPSRYRRLPRGQKYIAYVPDAWHDPTKTKIGYEIPLTRHFYTYTPPRPLHQIDAEIKSPRSRDTSASGPRDGLMISNWRPSVLKLSANGLPQ